MTRIGLALLALAACNPPSDPRVDAATPPWAPLSGGTLVTLTGAGFHDDARVFVGGREAPLVRFIDDGNLEIIVPPGARPGPAETLVIGAGATAVSPDAIRYSAPPAITGVSPRDVVASVESVVTVTGTGFLDEDAGDPQVLLEGLPTSVQVVSDTEMRVSSATGRPLLEPELTLVNRRGAAVRSRAFRYRPTAHGGLLVFTQSSPSFATFVDPLRGEVVDIPRVPQPNEPFLVAAVVDGRGEYWGLDNGGSRFGRLDLSTQTLEQAITLDALVPAIDRIGPLYVAFDRITRTIGSLDVATGRFTPRTNTTVTSCIGGCDNGIAHDGAGTVWFAVREVGVSMLQSMDLATGALGVAFPVSPPGLRIDDLRFYQGTLYAVCSDRTVRSVDLTTGATFILTLTAFSQALEVFE
ncbi:MAG: IPT/TIG domain-containing protein [Deltaproteobacteria bacterium]|nr:IPT/TIG domain-containing protein [Deltaproteobacteria bacterium]